MSVVATAQKVLNFLFRCANEVIYTPGERCCRKDEDDSLLQDACSNVRWATWRERVKQRSRRRDVERKDDCQRERINSSKRITED